MPVLETPCVDDLLKECARAFLGRGSEDLGRRPGLEESALFQEDDEVRDLFCELHFVGSEDHCHSLPCQITKNIEDLCDKFWIECRRDLVQ